MLDEFSDEEFKNSLHLFQDKIEDQMNRLDVVRDKVGNIKENYDKKFDGVCKQFKEIERSFLDGKIEEETLEEIKSAKKRQETIKVEINDILQAFERLEGDLA